MLERFAMMCSWRHAVIKYSLASQLDNQPKLISQSAIVISIATCLEKSLNTSFGSAWRHLNASSKAILPF